MGIKKGKGRQKGGRERIGGGRWKKMKEGGGGGERRAGKER